MPEQVSILTHHGDGCNGAGADAPLDAAVVSILTHHGDGCNDSRGRSACGPPKTFRSSPITETGATSPRSPSVARRSTSFDPHPSRRRVQLGCPGERVDRTLHHVSILTHHGDGCNLTPVPAAPSTTGFRSSPITETGATFEGRMLQVENIKFRSSPITETGATGRRNAADRG